MAARARAQVREVESKSEGETNAHSHTGTEERGATETVKKGGQRKREKDRHRARQACVDGSNVEL